MKTEKKKISRKEILRVVAVVILSAGFYIGVLSEVGELAFQRVVAIILTALLIEKAL